MEFTQRMIDFMSSKKTKVTDAEIEARIQQTEQEAQAAKITAESAITLPNVEKAIETVEATETALTVLPAVVTVDKALADYSASLSPADSREASEVTAYVIEKKQAAGENILSMTQRLRDYKVKIGAANFRVYVNTVLSPAGIVKESALNGYFARLKVLEDYFPHETVRKAFLRVGDGRNLIVSATLTKEERKKGDKPSYIVAPTVAKAMTQVPLVTTGRISEETAEVFAKQVLKLAQVLRKSEPDLDKDAKRRTAADVLRKGFKNFIEAYGTDATDALITSVEPAGLFTLYMDKASLSQVEDLLGTLDTRFNQKTVIAARKDAA